MTALSARTGTAKVVIEHRQSPGRELGVSVIHDVEDVWRSS
jgi:hypothetical protein